MGYPYPTPELEERFLPNSIWKTGGFLNPETNHSIHYSYSLIQAPIGTVICLPGLSEFSEKYIETTKFLNDNGYNVFIMDWAYQGRSTRFTDNSHKRYSNGYETDISDLHFFIQNEIKTNTKLYFLGHSMGGHIALRYLIEKDHNISAASLSAPMLGIKSLRYFPCWLACLFNYNKTAYVPGGQDWHEEAREKKGKDIFSSDPIRSKIHQDWSRKDSALQVGNATLKWLCESLRSIRLLKRKSNLRKIEIPIFFAYAQKESLIDNKYVVRAARIVKNAKLLKLKNSKHEILMETDDIRDQFLNKTLEFFKQSN